MSISIYVAAYNWATKHLSQAADMSYVFVVCQVRQWDFCVTGNEQRDIFSTSSSLLYTLILIPLLPLSLMFSE